MAPRYIALAAGAALCLQGCFDVKEHAKGFIEFTCGIQVTKFVDSIEEKLNDELIKRCEQFGEQIKDFATPKCVDDGAKDIQDGVKEEEDKYKKECIEKLNNATDNLASIQDTVTELVNSWTPDPSKIQEKMDSTLNDLKDKAQKKLDEAKESAQEQLDNAHESLSDHLNTNEETRLYSAGRLPRIGMGSTVSVACVAVAALVAMAGLVVFQRRHMTRNTGVVYMEPVEEQLVEDGEFGQ